MSRLRDNTGCPLCLDAKKYYDISLPEVRHQAPNPVALCSALIENNALQLVSDQSSQWRLHHAVKQVDDSMSTISGRTC